MATFDVKCQCVYVPLSGTSVRKMRLFLTLRKRREAWRGLLFSTLLYSCCCWSLLVRNTRQNCCPFQSACCQRLHHPEMEVSPWSEALVQQKQCPVFECSQGPWTSRIYEPAELNSSSWGMWRLTKGWCHLALPNHLLWKFLFIKFLKQRKVRFHLRFPWRINEFIRAQAFSKI